MSGINESGNDSEIANRSYVQTTVTVGTSQVEAKVGGSRLDGRQMLRIFNTSNKIIYFGPSGVSVSTGEPLEKEQWVNIAVGDGVAIFLIAATAGNVAIVSEWA